MIRKVLSVLILFLTIFLPMAESAPTPKFMELMQLGIKKHDSGLYIDAIEFYKKAIRIDNNAWAWYEVGYSYMKMDDDDNASIAFDKALMINPKYYKAYLQLGYLFAKHDQPDIGNMLNFKAYLIEPQASGAINNIAINLKHLGEDKLLEYYRLVLARYPDNSLLLYNLSQLYDKGKIEYLTDEEIAKRELLVEAISSYKKLQKRNTLFYEGELDYFIGLTYLAQGKQENGKRHIDLCVSSNYSEIKNKCKTIVNNHYQTKSTIEQKEFNQLVWNYLLKNKDASEELLPANKTEQL